MTQEAQNEWVVLESQRKAFWATVRDLGLTEEEAREALGLGPDEDGEYASTRSYGGDLDAALKDIAEYADQKRSDQSAAQVRESGEPPCVLFSQALTSKGWELNFTVRGATVQDALDEFARITKKLEGWGAQPLVSSRYQLPMDTVPVRGNQRTQGEVDVPPESHKPPQASGAPRNPPQPSNAQYPNHSKIKRGTVKEITVKSDGKIELLADTTQYPLKDARGAEAVADVFDDDCWTQQFPPIALSTPGVYAPQGLVVTYGKSNTGYWDILHVQRGH